MGSQTLDKALGMHISLDSTNIPPDTVIASDIADNSIVNAKLAAGAFAKITSIGTLAADLIFGDAIDVVLDTTTGTKIGTATNQKLGFYNKAPVIQPTALSTVETTLTFVDENTPDFLLSSLKLHSDDTGAGFGSLDEAQGFVEVVVNMQARVLELETKLQALGLLA